MDKGSRCLKMGERSDRALHGTIFRLRHNNLGSAEGKVLPIYSTHPYFSSLLQLILQILTKVISIDQNGLIAYDFFCQPSSVCHLM